MPVIDASVLVEYLGAGDREAVARERIREARNELWAPHLAEIEVGHALRSKVLAGTLRASAASTALRDLTELPLLRVPHTSLLQRAWELRSNVSFYDAIYLALAERLGVPLVTLDARLARVPRLRVSVEILAAS